MTDLFLCVDPGASQTKIIYQLSSENSPHYLLMPPQIESISQAAMDSYFNSIGWIGNPAPVQQAWLKVNDEIFVLGEFADQFDPEDRIKELKYENALYKVLAVIGLIQEQHNLNSKKKLSIQLALLLPANEYSDRQLFQDRLELLLSRFSFRNTTIKAKLERFSCRPEGAGLASIAIVRQSADWLRKRQLGILMFGHRNVTILYFDHGFMRVSVSPLIGFSNFLDSVIEAKSGLNRNSLTEALFTALDNEHNLIGTREDRSGNGPMEISFTQHPDWKEIESIKDLATAKDLILRQQEIEVITNAIENATEQYWSKLSKKLSKILPKNLDVVIVSGGASRFLKPEIEEYFNCQPCINKSVSQSSYYDCCFDTRHYDCFTYEKPSTPIIWGSGLQWKISQTFNLENSQQSLSYRLIDAYGLFSYLLATSKSKSKPVASSPGE